LDVASLIMSVTFHSLFVFPLTSAIVSASYLQLNRKDSGPEATRCYCFCWCCCEVPCNR